MKESSCDPIYNLPESLLGGTDKYNENLNQIRFRVENVSCRILFNVLESMINT
jgi:hypothetical protein